MQTTSAFAPDKRKTGDKQRTKEIVYEFQYCFSESKYKRLNVLYAISNSYYTIIFDLYHSISDFIRMTR